jgi:hypothetical protein
MTDAETQVEEPVEETGSGLPSLLDSLRKQREEIAGAQSRRFALPGYNGSLYAEYRLLDSHDANEIVRRAQKQFRKDPDESELIASIDLLIKACTGIFGVPDGEQVPLNQIMNEEGGNYPVPIRYDTSLAEILGFEASSAREAVMGVFGGNSLAIIAHARGLQMWFANTNADVDFDFLGEM